MKRKGCTLGGLESLWSSKRRRRRGGGLGGKYPGEPRS